MRKLALLCALSVWPGHAGAQPRGIDKSRTADLPPAVRAVAEGLYSSDPVKRAEAAQGLGGLGATAAPAAPLLSAMLEDDAPVQLVTSYTGGLLDRQQFGRDWSPGAQAAMALAVIRCTACVEALAESLGHAKPVVRVNAAHAISQRRLKEPGIVAPMIAALQDAEKDVRRSAARWLKERPDERVAPALMAALRDTDSEVRSEALTGLKSYMDRFEDPRLADALAGVLGDESRSVRLRAAKLLATLEDKRAAPALIAVLRDASARTTEKDEAVLYLKRLSGQTLGADPAAWERWLKEATP